MFEPPSLFLAAVVTCVGGAVRGFTEFAGPMMLLPVMTLLFGPVAGVVTVLLVNLKRNLILVPEATRAELWRAAIPAPIYMVSTFCGSRLFQGFNETLFRRAVLIVVICVSISGLVITCS